jgi:hypothetical protein
VTPASLPSPPDPFPNVNTQILRSGTILHRTHASAFRPTQFNPCKGEATRFAPFTDVSGDCVPTLYAATNREAAAFESIFHDIAPGGSFKTVRLSTVEARAVSKISPRRDLVVARLFSPDLKLWGLSRTDLIETPKLVYDQTVLWAKAIHQARPDLDGLIWTSRQCDPEQCVILFEDRISESEFDIIEQVDVSADGNLLLELRAFGQRAGITIIA